jgi:hypothetical protein
MGIRERRQIDDGLALLRGENIQFIHFISIFKEACSGQNIRFCQQILMNGSFNEEKLLKRGKNQLNTKIGTLRRRLAALKAKLAI